MMAMPIAAPPIVSAMRNHRRSLPARRRAAPETGSDNRATMEGRGGGTGSTNVSAGSDSTKAGSPQIGGGSAAGAGLATGGDTTGGGTASVGLAVGADGSTETGTDVTGGDGAAGGG